MRVPEAISKFYTVDVPHDADAQTKMLAFIGRDLADDDSPTPRAAGLSTRRARRVRLTA